MLALGRRLAWIPLTLLLASPAFAAVPAPPVCSVDPVLVGDSNGMQILTGFRVTIRDAASNPIAGSIVTLSFAGVPRPYTLQVPPAAVTCPTIVGTTDALGQFTFRPRFGGFANAPAVLVSADGINLVVVPARSTDINGDGATNVADFNIFRFNYLHNPAAQETDFDQTGATDIGDFNIFRQVFLNDNPGVPCP
jgi:hypothetical protein